jgi:hypothetical protein
MARYATKECSRCHIVLPANQMHKASGTVASGFSEHFRNGLKTGSTKRYSNRVSFLCPPCYRRSRIEMTIGLIAFAVFIIIVMATT